MMPPELRESAPASRLRRLRAAVMRRAFVLLYGRFAWSYDAVAWAVSLGQWRAWGRATLPYLRGPRVLDLGHGTGNLLLDLAGAGLHPVGCDLSPAMARIAAGKLARWRLSVTLARAHAGWLPFRAGSFGARVSAFPAEFIVHPDTLREVWRVLVPEGVLVVVLSAHLTGRRPAGWLIDRLYALAGQGSAGELSLPPQFQVAGFQGEARWVSLPSSRVFLVVLRKT